MTAADSTEHDAEATDDPLVAAAEEAVRTDGAHALSLRRIAATAGTSTQAVYTRFGGKAGLVDALMREGFRRLGTRLEQVDPSMPPLERIRALGDAYLENALDNPHLYEIMTGLPLPEYDPPAESRRFARSTLQPLIDAVTEAVEQGELEGDPREIAQRMWATGHGFVSLVHHGLDSADDVADRYRALSDAVLAGHRPGAVTLRR